LRDLEDSDVEDDNIFDESGGSDANSGHTDIEIGVPDEISVETSPISSSDDESDSNFLTNKNGQHKYDTRPPKLCKYPARNIVRVSFFIPTQVKQNLHNRTDCFKTFLTEYILQFIYLHTNSKAEELKSKHPYLSRWTQLV